jgi:hypothetical protein
MPWLKERWAKAEAAMAEAAKGQKDAGSSKAKEGAKPGKAQDAAMRNGHGHAPSEAQKTEYAKPQPAAHPKARAEGRGKGKGAAALKTKGEISFQVQHARASMATTPEPDTPQRAVPRSQAEIVADLESGIMNRASPERMTELTNEYLTGTVPEVAEILLSLTPSMVL